MKKLLAILLACMLFLSLSACSGKEPQNKPGEVRWPNTELVSRLPIPDSLSGKVLWESSEAFSVELINISKQQYDDYVDACIDQGFTVDYYRDESDFWALDGEGYDLSVDYDADMLIMGISIDLPDAETDDDDMEESDLAETTTTATAKPTATTAANASGDLDADFKAAMDSYEAFMDNYVAFMKKYQANPSDLGLLVDYADYMSQYATLVEDFEGWEDEDMNDAELAYYLEVQTRVSQKLLEIAG